MDQEQKVELTVPVAIILAGALVAGAVLYSNGKPGITVPANTGVAAVASFRPVDQKDHILGNPRAKVKVIEFSDTECPFCKRFHETMHKVMNEHSSSGDVAWIYRHFPLDSLHPKAAHEAVATECAAELGGNDGFWKYVDRIFAVTPSNNGLDVSELPKIAEAVGLDRVAFEACLASNRYQDKVNTDRADALSAGAQGTPYSVVINASGKQFIINGAQPYESVKETIEQAFK